MSDPLIYIEFTEAREGGLSNAKTDTASKYAWPQPPNYHTNKGITRETFERLGPILGYKPTYELFIEMPDVIFDKIFNHFWDESGAGLIDSQPIANLIFQSLWGGGHDELIKALQKYFGGELKVDGYLGQKTADKVNSMCAKSHIYAKMLYEYLHKKRLDYLRSLSSYKANGKGWEARMEKLYKFNITLMK
jgi:lysozyme family protein